MSESETYSLLIDLLSWTHGARHDVYLWFTSPHVDIPFKIFLSLAIAYLARHFSIISSVISRFKKEEVSDSFRPELPPLSILPSPHDPSIKAASAKLSARLEKLYAGGLVESVTVMVVTANGPIFSKGCGVVNPKESDPEKRGSVDENTIYRISSLTKLFTTLKLWMLKERGAIAWDDNIKKYIPQFAYAPGSWEQHLTQDPSRLKSPAEPITLRQLASHTAGIPRDFPPPQIPKWPESMDGAGLPHYHTTNIPAEDKILEAVKSYPLSNTPYFQPLYSNTGFALLGMACMAASSAHEGSSAPKSFPESIRRDIFEPLGMHSSSFHVTDENRARVAIASTDNEELDVDLKALNPSYGALSSAADLAKVMQTFLDPTRRECLISPYTFREWLRPMFAWIDDLTEVGLLWEILKIPCAFGRRQRAYQKLGEFNGHYSAFAFNPTSSFGVIVLMTGSYRDSESIVVEAFKHFQPVFDDLKVQAATETYAGKWKSEDGSSEAVISVVDGSLWMDKYSLKGNDVLAILRDDKTEKMALASTGRDREFRLAKGYRPVTGWRHYGAMSYWVINSPGHSRGAAVDLIYFAKSSDGLTLEIPSAGISLRRV